MYFDVCVNEYALVHGSTRRYTKGFGFVAISGFLDLGALLKAMLAHLGAMLGHLGAILEQLGDKMCLESAKMSQDSGQERQDETRWRK